MATNQLISKQSTARYETPTVLVDSGVLHGNFWTSHIQKELA